MEEGEKQKPELKKNWGVTRSDFHGLIKWLGGEKKYKDMRNKLILFFDRKNCLSPEELTDETLTRVARKLEEVGSITGIDPTPYCLTIARRVCQEYWRKTERNQENLDDLPVTKQPAWNPFDAADLEEEREKKEKRLDCLEDCLRNLEPGDRELIMRYYSGEQHTKLENRKALAAKRGMSAKVLHNKTCRLRSKLKDCVTGCMSE